MKWATLALLICVTSSAWAQSAAVPKEVQTVYPDAPAASSPLRVGGPIQRFGVSSWFCETAVELMTCWS